MPLPDGVVQATEGVTRCPTCHREVIEGRTQEWELVLLSPVKGERHLCAGPTVVQVYRTIEESPGGDHEPT